MIPDVHARGQLVPFEKDGKWGYRDKQGVVIIKPKFILAHEFFPEGIAAVIDNTGWGYINRRGVVIIRPFVFDNGPDPFQEGLARFIADGKFGFFDRMGKIVIKSRFDFSAPFREGFSAFCTGCRKNMVGEHGFWESGKWGYINRKGEVAIAAKFESAKDFENGKAQVKLDKKWIYIDYKGVAIKATKEEASIGSARMEKDGTIVLQLRAEAPGRQIGDALLRYPPNHPQYKEILRHLGGLEKGQEKRVPPWKNGK